MTFTVSDGTATDGETITITVAEVNLPPVLAAIGNQTVDELATLAFTVSADDRRPAGQPLTYSASGLPAGEHSTRPRGSSAGRRAKRRGRAATR